MDSIRSLEDAITLFCKSAFVVENKFSPLQVLAYPVVFASLRGVLVKNTTGVSVTEFVLEMERIYRMNIETAAWSEICAANENSDVSKQEIPSADEIINL